MSVSGSSGSAIDNPALSTVLATTLHIPGYHFKAAPTPNLSFGEDIDLVYGYRISNKQAVVAKVSPNSLRLEREYYIMKRLYQLQDGNQYLVRPLEYINLPSGLTVVIYADEGQHFLNDRRASDELSARMGGGSASDQGSSAGSLSSDSNLPAAWLRSRYYNTVQHHQNHYDVNSSASNIPAYDLGTFLRFAIKCLDCLEFIHRHSVVHGEIRLSAFQWSGDDNSSVKMWNFGASTKSLETHLTSEGWRKTANKKESLHTLQNMLAYMSPEQTGRTTYAPDHRSDIYSLGVVFFVLLTGRNPYDGGPLEIINGILSRKMSYVHELQMDVPEVLSRIIEKMTNKAPDNRYSSAHGVREDLKECLRRLTAAAENAAEPIPPFPLAQHDIASIFTLPRSVYGRQNVISEMTYIIERFVGPYKSTRSRLPGRSSYATNSNFAARNQDSNNGSVADSMSDISGAGSNGYLGPKSPASPSYCSGFDSSDVSSAKGRHVGGANSKQNTTIVAVYGPGGVGKSTVFNAVMTTARQNGYVAIVKFDSRAKIPYSGALRSLSQILQQILSEPEDEINAFYDHLKTSLGTQFCNVPLLADLVPELRPLLDPSIEVTETIDAIHMDNVETRIRFHNLFVEVFRAITFWRMTTLFFDDIHQADDPSVELLESLVVSRVKILLFTAYRDQEVTARLAHLLEHDMATLHYIKIESLDFDSLVDYLCDTLHRSKEANRDSVAPLAKAIHRKTQGNAFYTAQWLRTLERKKLIFFNWEQNQWDYNLSEIEQAGLYDPTGPYGDSQLDIGFLVERLKELPKDGQMILKWASFIGDTFSWNTVKDLMLASDPEDNDDGDESVKSSESSVCSDASDRTARNRPLPTIEEPSDDSEVSVQSLHPLIKLSMQPGDRNAHKGILRHRKPNFNRDTSGSSSSSRNPINGLQTVLQEGYIMPIESDEFKWSHDRISQAAMELANPKARARIHMKIAQYLLKEKEPDTFLIADHLLKCTDLVQAQDDKHIYRQVFIEAGNKARSSGAHGMAYAYYMAAIDLTDTSTAWESDQYVATLHLYSNAVSLSWVVGEYEKTEDLLEIIFQHVRDPLDRSSAHRIQSKYYFARQMHERGRDALHRCLEELGIEASEFKTTSEEVDREFLAVKDIILKIGLDQVVKVGPCEDVKLKAIMNVVEELCTVAYWLGNPQEMFYWACRIVHLSLIKGMTSSSGVAIVLMGMTAIEVYKMFNFGEELGALGVDVADKYGTNYEKGRASFLYANICLAWKYHHKEALPYYRNSLQMSLSAGDRIYASFAQLLIATSMFTLGCNLSEVLHEAETSFEDIHSWSASVDTNTLVMSIIRLIKALQGHTFYDSANVFDGDDGFSDAHFVLESCKQSSNPEVPMNWYDSFKMIPLVLYGHYEEAVKTGYNCMETIYNHPCHRHTRMMATYHSLAILEKLRQGVEPDERQELLRRVRENQALVYEWAEHSRVNYMMFWTLVQAELESSYDSVDVVRVGHLYEDAINQAREGNWYFELCVAHEYAGAFYDRIGMKNVAYGFIRKAVELYVNHGSYGKARHLGAKYNELLTLYNDDRTGSLDMGVQTDPFPFLGPQNTWSTSSLGNANAINEPYSSEHIPPVTTEQSLLTLDILDMASILKSSQVMSSEVKFDGLLTYMMTIILENSAADCGAIIVKEDKFGVCAYGSQQEGSTTYDPPRPLSESDDRISTRIIHHTIHTGESIFVQDVSTDARFAVGPWFERVGKKSVICMPIIHKTALAGCLFIEGAVGIFTQRHVTVLSLLCQQMGISITNAFLFKSVQRVTMANMRMIEMQKQALEDARKSKEAADRATRLREIFLANMSHEIRTPFSGFYGMISLLAETELDSEQRDLVKTAKESCEVLLQIIDDLLNFSKLQAGKVSLDLSPVVVEEIIADVIEMLMAMAIQKRINITYTIGNDVPSVVIADGNRLRQIIINLLGNAIKFTHEGEISVRCSVDKRNSKKDPDDKIALLFEVEDSGIGISEDQRKVLFAPFSQVDGSTTRKYGGTGLGLSICLQLVQLMSGRIDVTSIPGKGSNFHFTIRVSRVPDQSLKRNNTVASLLNELHDTRVLVAGLRTSTITMIRQMLPGVPVDGISNIDDIVRYKATHYPVIIVGLFLTHDPEFDVWYKEMNSFLQRARCVIVMHYPNGLGDEQVHIPLLTPTANRRAVVRLAVPLRRQKLLQTMVDMVREASGPPPSTERIGSDDPKASSDAITPEERELFSTMHILAAEDNPVAQKLLYKQLTRLGFQVECANNGVEAVEAWTKHPPGHFKMGFFDHHMPKCDGVEATKRIRSLEKQENRKERFPIVALTADVQDSARETCMKAGMDEYLTKPLNQKVLAEALRRYCKDP